MKFQALLVAACLGGFVAPAMALIVKNPGNQNYRFMDNALGPINSAPDNPIFIGKNYDLSGIAVKAADGAGNNHPAGAMMLSSHYYVTATHYASQASLSFRSRDGRTITKTIEGGRAMTSDSYTSDIYIGKLAGDGITAEDQVSYYPVIVQPANNWKWYVGKDMLVYSMNGGNAVGINTIAYTGYYRVLSYTGMGANFKYVGAPDATSGPSYDNMAGVNGESGSPWGLIWNGQFTAGGAHSGYYGTASSTGNYTSVSSFLPFYVNQINAFMAESYPAEHVTIQSVPEPTGLTLLIGGCALLICRKRCHLA